MSALLLPTLARRHGKCECCGTSGALQGITVLRRRYWIVGRLIAVERFYCEECDTLSGFIRAACKPGWTYQQMARDFDAAMHSKVRGMLWAAWQAMGRPS
jgi:hypothetical protein